MGKYLALYLLASGIFLGHYAIAGQAVYGDGIDYWTYLHSWYFDRDADFTNEYRHNYSPFYNNNRPEYEDRYINKPNNFHVPGTALILLPAYALADLIVVAGNLVGVSLPRNGYSDVYQITTGLWAVAVGVVGVAACAALTRSKLAAIATFLATPMLYYGAYDVLNSHFASFTLSAVFWWVLLRYSGTRKPIYLGLIIGLATLVRLQDILLIIPGAIYLIWDGKLVLKRLLTMVVAVGVVLSPLIGQWWNDYGRVYPLPYTVNWSPGSGLWGSWFHPTNGLFWRTPVLFVSMAGLFRGLKLLRRPLVLMLLYFAAQSVVITVQGGWAAAAYGGRMYITTLPMFAVLLSFVIQKIPKALVWGLVFLNFISIGSFVLFEKEVNSGKKRGLEEHTIKKLERLLPRTFGK